MTEYKLFLRDQALGWVAEISEYAQFECLLQFNAVSTWTLSLSTGLRAATLFYDEFKAKRDVGVIFTADDQILMSGSVRNLRRTKGGAGRANLLEVSGIDDTGLLAEWLAFQAPAENTPPYQSQNADVRTGVASTVMRQYVDANIGPGARSGRPKSGLVLGTNPNLGSTVTGRVRFDYYLLDLLAELARIDGLRFDIKQSLTASQIVFNVYATRDLTDLVRFSVDLGNLREITEEIVYPSPSWAIAGGEGEGVTRLYREAYFDPANPTVQHVEAFIDRRGVAFSDELDQTIDEVLKAGQGGSQWDLDPIDTDKVQFGRDYGLGDQVTVIMDDEVQADAFVAQAMFKFDGSGWEVRPSLNMIGGSLQRVEDADVQRVEVLSRRVQNLEAQTAPQGIGQVIEEQILGADAATITFSGIADTYRHLQVRIVARSSAAASNEDVRMRFNGDASAIYDTQRGVWFDSNFAAFEGFGQTFAAIGAVAANSAAAGLASHTVVDIADYSRTSWHKYWLSQSYHRYGTTTNDMESWRAGGNWRNTAAITQVQLFLAAGNFRAGTIATLSGLL